MNEFTNKQRSRRPRQSNSVDGFGTPRRSAFQAPKSSSGSNPSIGNFSAKEGFTSRNRNRTVQGGGKDSSKNSSSSIASNRSAVSSRSMTNSKDEPLLIEKQPVRQKRRFFIGPKRPVGPKKPWSRKKKIIVGIAGFLTVLLLIFGFLVLKGYINIHKVLGGGGGAAALDANVDPSKLKGEGDGRVNILLLGRGGEGHEGADLTDTVILASIDPVAKEAALLSVPRDLYVPVDNYGSMKINAVFSTGKTNSLNKVRKPTSDDKKKADEAGYNLLEKTVEKNLGVPVHYRATIDFNGFKQAVDTVGGVDLNVPSAVAETMRIDGKTYKLDVKPGQQHMDGFKALAYSRSRYTSARGDFDRSERQRLIIVALKEKIMSAGTYSNPAKISGLLDNLGNHVQSNFSVNDLSRLYQLGKEINQSKIMSIGLADPPNNYVTTSNIGGQSVVIPRAGAGNYKEIQSYIRNALKDSFIRNENASIVVLNGTQTTGLATTKGDELKSYGYNVTNVGNAPTKNYTKTVLVDLRSGNKKYTKNYLEKRFGVTATGTIPDSTIQAGNADFVIILGNDQAGQ